MNARRILLALLGTAGLAAVLAGIVFAVKGESSPRSSHIDSDSLTNLIVRSTSHSERDRARIALRMLEDGVDDEAPYLVQALVAYERDRRANDPQPGLILKFISEVYTEGILQVADGKGSWIETVLGDERLRAAKELKMRALIVPLTAINLGPNRSEVQFESTDIRLMIRGKTSNTVRLDRFKRND